MPDKKGQSNTLACEQWEAMLAEALDGPLAAEAEAQFDLHAKTCPACALLLEESKRGRQWLQYLSTEPPVPSDLLSKILAQTSGVNAAVAPAGNGIALPAPKSSWTQGAWFLSARRAAEPRMMMTAAMAFFSIALTLNVTGLLRGNVRLADLSPATLRSTLERQFASARRPVVRYYDNLRFVYEVEARVREFRRTEEQEEPAPQKREQQPAPQNHNGSAQKNNNMPGKDGGSMNEVERIAPAPVPDGQMLEARFEKYADKNLVCNGRDSFTGLNEDQAERSLA